MPLKITNILIFQFQKMRKSNKDTLLAYLS